MSWYGSLLLLLLILALTACQEVGQKNDAAKLLANQRVLPTKVDFNFHVKPILSDRCFKCHGPDKNTRDGALAFHDKELAFAALGEKHKHYAIIPNDTVNSTLLQRIFHTDPNEVMPPPSSNLSLSDYEKEILKRWIAQGAEWKTHWAFIPPKDPPLPTVQQPEEIQNEIDLFILKKLEIQGLNFSPRASKEKLIRRVSFDLTGLPPTLATIENFLADDSANAFEKVVDQLLATPAYAERMATDWMDLARYADTHGYQDDFERTMWPWRDWVIHAFDKNMPYDDFVRNQIAGDLLPDPSLEQLIATGFNRNHKITYEGGAIDEEYRTDYVSDRTQTFGTAFLGLTIECAKCHDHKYDPISQKDYYALFGYFNNVPEKGFIEDKAFTPKPYLTLTPKEIAAQASFINNLDSLTEIKLMIMREKKQARKTFVLNRGLYDQLGEEVVAAPPHAIEVKGKDFPTNRLGLVDWLFDPAHPLTARVAVNRLWQQVFGQGIVASAFDFGNQGTLPSHPELLDFLALKFQKEAWDMKAMLKYMVLSRTYQQSAKVSKQALQYDPENTLLARAPRRRLTSEMIRDQVLQISNLLHTTVGGRSVKPYQPEGLWEETTGGGGGSTAKYVRSEGADLYRRSLYTFWKRTVPPPSMLTFDAASRDLCTIKRQETNTPLQALVLLNDPQLIEACRAMAADAFALEDNSPQARIRYLFKIATSRFPTDTELNSLEAYLHKEQANFDAHPEQAKQYLAIGDFQGDRAIPATTLAAYALLANTILNLDEAISRG